MDRRGDGMMARRIANFGLTSIVSVTNGVSHILAKQSTYDFSQNNYGSHNR